MTSKVKRHNKEIVWTFWQAIDQASPEELTALLPQYMTADSRWYGAHPLNELHGVEAIAAKYWQPLKEAFSGLRRESYLFFSGRFQDKDWVTATGHFKGKFVNDWLGIRATEKEISLRFGEFCALQDGKISETYLLLDLLDLLQQGGIDLLPHIYGGEVGVYPPPLTQDGVLLTEYPPEVGQQSAELVEAMIMGLMRYNQKDLASMEQVRYWHTDMQWYGPAGIGTTRTLKGFEEKHQLPFLLAFPDRKGGHHKARFAEGMYVASTGWPSIFATHRASYLGAPVTGKQITMRVMDWWRCEGEYIKENWVLIDMIDLFYQFGINLFDRLKEQQV